MAQALSPTDVTYPKVTVQDSALEYRQFERVEITGSSIVRKEQTQTLPVQIVTRAEIQRGGKHSVADYLQTLPVVVNGFSPAVMGTTRSGFSGAAIHGLQTGTLVLVNGRRLANYGRQTNSGVDNGGVDLNALPLSAIDRVEILTDGASSVYGTDAQTGVINIITRTDRPGLEITADHRMPDGQKGQGSRMDVSFGKGQLATDGFSWYVSADVAHQQELLGRDRPYAAAGRYLLQQNGQDHWAYGAALTTAQTGTTLASSKSAPYARLWNADHQNGACLNGNVPTWGKTACLDNNYQDKGLYPELSAARLHTQGQLQINANITAYAELSWQESEQRRSYNTWGTYAARIGQSPASPGYDLAVSQGFDPAQGAWLLYSGSALGPASRKYELQTRRWVSGLKGQWQAWDFNGSVFYSDNTGTFSNQTFNAYPNLGVNSQLQLFTPMINIGKTQTAGVDVSWAFRRPIEWGQLHLGINGTFLLKSRYQLADGEPFVSDLNTYSSYTGMIHPKLKTRWHAGLQQANWQWLATVNHVGSHDDGGSHASGVNPIQAGTGEAVFFEGHRVPAWWTLDLMVAHQWGPRTSVRLGIENALNRRAPIDFGFTSSFNYGTNPMLANVWGRTVNLSVTHRF